MSPDDAAAAARAELGLDEISPVPDLVALLEQAGANVYVVDFGCDGIDGACLSRQDRWFIFCNGEPHIVKRRFTLAHEFGHLKLGHGEQIDDVISMVSTDAKEIAANQFAAAFLVPEAGLNAWASEVEQPYLFDGLVRAAGHFGVSAQMMCFRYANLQKIDELTKNTFGARIGGGEHSRIKYRDQVEVFGESTDQSAHVPRVPDTLRESIGELVRRKTIDDDLASDLLRVPKEEVRSVLQEREEESEPNEQ